MKRICIYLTYDKERIIDSYIGYMLRELRTCVDDLVVVCNEPEIIRGREYLENYADEIYYRENIGFDAGGFKDALCTYLGWEKIWIYDELILVNDSFFGPFKPMSEIFSEMEQRIVDFWGLTKHAAWADGDESMPEHIQSFFMVIRKKMLNDIEFCRYWENMPYFRTFIEVVKNHEIRFTDYFAKRGYSYDCLADMQPNDSCNIKNNYVQYGAISYELIRLRNFPFLKKQQIVFNTLSFQTQENLRLSIDYIDKHTDYDVDLIWQNIIRTLRPEDLYKKLNLHYIIQQNKFKDVVYIGKRVILAVFIKYKESFEYIDKYIEPLQKMCAVRIYALSDDLLKPYKEKGYEGFRLVDELTFYSVVLQMGGYMCVCVIHDSDMSGNYKRSCTGKSYFYSIWDNLLKDKEHITEIAETFEKEKRLGLLVPPLANFGTYFENFGKNPFHISANYWIRGEILKNLINEGCEAAALLPDAVGRTVQKAGFYSGVVESANYASMNEINLQYYLDEIAAQIRQQYGTICCFEDVQEYMFQGAIDHFYRQHKCLYIYGTGYMAKKYGKLLPSVEAYVVSEGQPKESRVDGKDVIYLSELPYDEDTGIVVCLGKENQKEVLPLLDRAGYHNYLCVWE